MSRYSILHDGEIYDLFHQDQVEDVAFYLAHAVSCAGDILELCCGTGRVTIPIARQGRAITGLERDPGMLARARSHAGDLNITWIQGDAADFQLGRRFGLILVPFNSLQLLGDRSRIESFFRCVKEHLSDDGRLIFDVFNPNLDRLAPALSARRDAGAYTHPETGEPVSVEWRCHYDDARQVSRVTLFYSTSTSSDFAVDELDQRCFYPQELDLLIRSEGFHIVEKFGDFDDSPFATGAPKQIVVCVKRLGVAHE